LSYAYLKVRLDTLAVSPPKMQILSENSVLSYQPDNNLTSTKLTGLMNRIRSHS